MAPLWRNPFLAVGVVLFVLGLGNWLVSRNKIIEYSRRTDADTSVQRVGSLDEYPHLTADTNATLLERLHRGFADYTFSSAKLDFYQVVNSGGRFLSLVGMLLIGLTVVRSWLERRGRPGAPSSAL